MADNDNTCGALWYFGDDDRAKHVCHRNRRHLGGHHSDGGLSWSRDPHHRRPKLDLHAPCRDCEPAAR